MILVLTYTLLFPLQNIRIVWLLHVYQYTILITNIFNSLLVKILKTWYFKNAHQNKSNKTLYAYIYIYILL
jgi:hypothetical protein